jgi:hypothetical protein
MDMGRHRENFLANRAALVRGLAGLADRLPSDLLEDVFAVLGPLAEGVILEPTVLPTYAEASQPLASKRLKMGSPAQLQGMALYALARIKQAHPDAFRGRFQSLLEQALIDFDADVRRMAYYSARFAPKLSDVSVMALLSGLRDQDPEAAGSAFAALATKHELHLTKSQWRQVACAAKIASGSPSPVLRRTAAGALARLLHRDADSARQARIPELLDIFAKDVCASVREEATYQGE